MENINQQNAAEILSLRNITRETLVTMNQQASDAAANLVKHLRTSKASEEQILSSQANLLVLNNIACGLCALVGAIYDTHLAQSGVLLKTNAAVRTTKESIGECKADPDDDGFEIPQLGK